MQSLPPTKEVAGIMAHAPGIGSAALPKAAAPDTPEEDVSAIPTLAIAETAVASNLIAVFRPAQKFFLSSSEFFRN